MENMEPEKVTPAHDEAVGTGETQPGAIVEAAGREIVAPQRDGIRWVFIGPLGLRAGWSVAIFMVLFLGAANLIAYLLDLAHQIPHMRDMKVLTLRIGLMQELPVVLGLVFAAWMVARIERRRLTDYNLQGPGRVSRFFIGAVTGLAALSLLVAGLVAGGWMHFEGVGLSGGAIFYYAAGWGVVFLLVGCAEEGLVRCFLLFTLGRGLNFWWSLGMVGLMCGRVALNTKANGSWGTYAIALLGLAPCLVLYLKRAESEGFWDAAWVTSVLFGAGHTGNPGESWVGIFSAAGIGVVFCASVKVTGSAWWAIGCHAAWDWGQSYLYGTPDSGLVAHGHLLNSTYSQDHVIWSGGSTGPEGSLLILPGMLLILAAVLVQYGRRGQTAAPVASTEPAG
jgi:membrane protease YdiL (CAAX protease family)